MSELKEMSVTVPIMLIHQNLFAVFALRVGNLKNYLLLKSCKKLWRPFRNLKYADTINQTLDK